MMITLDSVVGWMAAAIFAVTVYLLKRSVAANDSSLLAHGARIDKLEKAHADSNEELRLQLSRQAVDVGRLDERLKSIDQRLSDLLIAVRSSSMENRHG